MAKFAKLFEMLDDEQLLVTLQEDNDEYLVVFKTEIDDFVVSTDLRYDTFEEQIEAFNKIDKDLANNLYQSMVKPFKDITTNGN